jgi:RHS repeat-associated protein
MRTLYDGTGFEVIREGAVFSDGRFTTRYSDGAQSMTNTGTEGSRYRWVGEGSGDVRTRVIYEDGYSTGTGRYTGISVSLYGRGEAVAVSRSAGADGRGGTAYLGKDVLGSVRSTTNGDGRLEGRYEYDAFGKPYKGDLASGMNLGYTGKPYDATTGLYNYGYRDYQPEAARFTTEDPIRDGSNWFAYVNNDPVNWIDLWGLENVYYYTVKEGIVDSNNRYNYNGKETFSYTTDYPSLVGHRNDTIGQLTRQTFDGTLRENSIPGSGEQTFISRYFEVTTVGAINYFDVPGAYIPNVESYSR